MATPATTTTPTASTTHSGTGLPEHIRTFLAATRFATLGTLDPDGRPHQAVTWYRLDGDDIIVNSKVGRRWPSNIVRDPRVSVAVTDQSDGYRWVGLTGTATVVDDQPTAQADIAEMARRYHADDPVRAERLIRDQFQRQRRISFRICIDAVHDHFD